MIVVNLLLVEIVLVIKLKFGWKLCLFVRVVLVKVIFRWLLLNESGLLLIKLIVVLVVLLGNFVLVSLYMVILEKSLVLNVLKWYCWLYWFELWMFLVFVNLCLFNKVNWYLGFSFIVLMLSVFLWFFEIFILGIVCSVLVKFLVGRRESIVLLVKLVLLM